ncbi:hypothetical protein HF086_002272 [Spodoptera exigua]|uniref:STIM1/2 Orai1-activating region domain-containing protein n=1 Tax=Spodoptera exigua TaxID=7107 RepID=A0A922SNG4_SPOEX|nr:hypothetical protein HF086_002272 [Spodoptera exigua]
MCSFVTSPKSHVVFPEGSRWKDWLLASLLLGAVVGGWAALRAGRASRHQVQRMLRDMEQLRKAEMALNDMQKELEKARLEQMLRAELRRAEGELEDRCWAPPPGLQQWLQLTHEVENRAYLRKKQQADMQLQQAREACEKLRKKRSSLVGAFVSTHGKSIDDVDRSIVEARTALNEVTQELQERMHRWKQIERMCRISSSQDDLSIGDDASICGSVADNFVWREDSSGSEADAPHYPLDLRLAEARVNWSGEPESPRISELSRAVISASQPQLRASVRGAPLPPPRRVLSSVAAPIVRSRNVPTPSSNTPPEEESTDSSLMDDEGVPKPRKRRIHLPFGKKAKTPA